MRKFFVLFASLLLMISLLSCKSGKKPDISGTWEADIMLKSDLAEPSTTGDIVKAFLYTKQNIVLTFSERGRFSKKVLQEVDRVEFISSSEDVEAAKEYFSRYCNKDLVFSGEYEQKSSIIVFEVSKVQSTGEEAVSYDEYFAKDPSIGADNYCENYEMKDDDLILNGVKFKKAEGSE